MGSSLNPTFLESLNMLNNLSLLIQNSNVKMVPDFWLLFFILKYDFLNWWDDKFESVFINIEIDNLGLRFWFSIYEFLFITTIFNHIKISFQGNVCLLVRHKYFGPGNWSHLFWLKNKNIFRHVFSILLLNQLFFIKINILALLNFLDNLSFNVN